MTDPLANLHGPRRPAPAGGVDRALTAGRRRLHRRRAATGAATLSLGVVASAALVRIGPGSGSGLQPTDGDRSGTPTAQARDDVPPSPVASATIVGPLPPNLGLGGTPSAEPSSGPSGGPSASPTPEAPRHYIGLGSRTIAVSTTHDSTACATTGVGLVPRTGWCTKSDGPTSLDPGTPKTFTYQLCRGAGEQTATRTFSDGEFVVHAYRSDRNDDYVDWTLDSPAPKHTVTFAAGDCRVWTYEWMGQDDAGYEVRAGQYEVIGWAPADEWTGEDSTEIEPAPTSVFIDVS